MVSLTRAPHWQAAGGLTMYCTCRAYSHDPARYPDPGAFKPERFLREGKIDPDVTDPADFAFGYGRRCVLTVLLSDGQS